MFSLEGGHTSHFTANVIIAVQNALTKSFAILRHAGFQVIIVAGILKKLEKIIIQDLTYIAKADRVFTTMATFKTVRMAGASLTDPDIVSKHFL